MTKKKIKVVELFAGVGGFRIGLEGWKGMSSSSNFKEKFDSNYQVIWSNQWEPSSNIQHASLVYENRFGKKGHSNEDIQDVVENKFNQIPDHDLLVGGFPCQDYSVATTLKLSDGLQGKKGVLWWSIEAILRKKKYKAPNYLMLENVDRLLNSPSAQRGRDFAVILSSLNKLGYAVEWRVINAGEYGMPQRRRRIFIVGYKKGTSLYNKIKNASDKQKWILSDGIFAQSFPVKVAEKTKVKLFSLISSAELTSSYKLNNDLVAVSTNFNKSAKNNAVTPFANSGVMVDGVYHCIKTEPLQKDFSYTLSKILQTKNIDPSFFIDEDAPLASKTTKEQIDGSVIEINTVGDKWSYLKGSKSEYKINSAGIKYKYGEGKMKFPDPLNSPSRTIITGEGGAGPSRFKHVVQPNGKMRRLTPIELERLNMFPDDHTKLEGISDTKRAFFMGNALVVGVIEKLGIFIEKHFETHKVQ